MNREQIIKNAKKFIAERKREIDKEIVRLIDSGAIDFSLEDPRSYGKVKAICKAALENVADKVYHFNNETEDDYKNLRKF